MSRIARPAWLRYLVGLLAVFAIMEARIGLKNMEGIDGPPLTMMLVAVIVAALFGGAGPGILSTVVGAMVCDYMFIDKKGSLLDNGAGANLRLVLFMLEGGFISWIVHAFKRSSSTTRQMERNLRLIADNTTDVIFAYDTAGQLLYVNPAFETLTGNSISELRENPFMNYVHPDDSLRMQERFGSLFQGKGFSDVEYRIITHDGAVKWCRATWGPLLDEFANQIGVQGRETDITEQRRSESTLRFLAETSAVLATPGDAEAKLGKLARAAVPQFADWCCVDLLGPDGTARTVAAAHADASKEPWLAEVQRNFPPQLSATYGRGKVLSTGQPDLVPTVTQEMLSSRAVDARHLKLLQNLAPRSSLSVPLRGRDRVLGAVTFVSSSAQRRYGADDLVFATDVARRVTEALEAAGVAGAGTSRMAVAHSA